MEDARWSHAHYSLKKQIFKLVGSNFFIYDPSGNLAFFVHQKGFKLKEDIRIFADDKQQVELVRISARSVMDFSAAYDVFDSPTGQKVGVLKRKGWASIARDEWRVCDQNEVELATLIEDNIALALARRLLTNLIPQNYDLLIGGNRAMDFRQNFNPFSYHLNVIFEPGYNFDKRLGIAAAVMLAAIEGRQSG